MCQRGDLPVTPVGESVSTRILNSRSAREERFSLSHPASGSLRYVIYRGCCHGGVSFSRFQSFAGSMLSVIVTATRIGHWRAALPWSLLGLTLASGCLYESGDRCDSTQRFDAASGVCVCQENTVPGEHGCESCPEHEVPQGPSCVCSDGYARPAEGGACALIPDTLGAACDPSAPSCAPEYPTCHPLDDTTGYCTAECTTSGECSGGFVCDTSSNPSYCQRPPTGVGHTCSSSADCAGFEATYCETLQAHVCLVQGCTKSPNTCFSGNDCCDLTMVGLPTLCVPTGTCPFP